MCYWLRTASDLMCHIWSDGHSHWMNVIAVLLQGAAPSGTDQSQTLDRMPVYIDRLHLMKEEGKTTLLVDFEHLNDYDGELAEVRCRPAHCWQVAAWDSGRQRCSASV